MPPSMIWEVVLGSFGVAAAVVLVGGWIFLRFHRDRQQFQLMQTALEKGITTLPGGVPGWVLSLRQGVLAMVLGLGVAASGGILAISSKHIDEIPASVSAHFDQNRSSEASLSATPPPPVEEGPGDRGHPDRPPPADPTLERWHRIQTQRLIGLLAACAGSIVALLGVVRMSFARIERRYAMEITGTGSRGPDPS